MSTEPQPKHRELGLADHEHDLILSELGRAASDVELAMLSLMWSERRAYKHSKKLLRRLPTDGSSELVRRGENAGVVDVGDGLAVAFKLASHAHPSAADPFDGAAAGVGDVLRQIFAAGARPIAVLDSLRVGEIGEPERSPYLQRAVAGIAHYAESIGVPTVGGEIYFEPSYERSCLISTMVVGIASHERLATAAAAGAGNVVILFGAPTGRDGIGGGSTLARKAMECSLELLDDELLTSIQGVGAAGLTAAAAAIASRGGVGLDIDVGRVPLREADLEPFEVIASESPDRMLCAVQPRLVEAVMAVCERWEVLATVVGEVADTQLLRVLRDGELVGELPVALLVDQCPLYDIVLEQPTGPMYPKGPMVIPTGWSGGGTLVRMLESANLTSRRPLCAHFHCTAGQRTVHGPERADAAVLALPIHVDEGDDGQRLVPAIAIAIDGNGRRVAVNPRAGAAEVVYESAANLACVGAEPLALTVSLNFGSPEQESVAWQLYEVIEGLAQACRDLEIQIVGSSALLYNESANGPILPTPVVGMLGKLPDARNAGRIGFHTPGERIALVGSLQPLRDGSEIAKLHGHPLAGMIPFKDVAAIRQAHETVRAGVRSGRFTSAHDIAEGGLAVALAESCIAGGLGARVQIRGFLDVFGEDLGTAFLVTGSEQDLEGLDVIGEVGGDQLDIRGVLIVSVADLKAAYSAGSGSLCG